MTDKIYKENASISALLTLRALSRYTFSYIEEDGIFKGFKYYEILILESLLGRICNRLAIMSKEKKDG